MRTKNLFLIIGLMGVLASCKNQQEGGTFTITGKFKNAMHPAYVGDGGTTNVQAVTKVYLYEVPFGSENTPSALDSATLSGDNGTFKLKGSGKEEGVYELMFNNGFIVLVSNDASHLDLEVDLGKKDNYYSVKGSEATQQMKDFSSTYSDYSSRVNRAFNEMDSLKRMQSSDSLIVAATSVKNNEIKTLNDYLKKFIGNTTHPSVALFALGWASRSFTKEEFEAGLASVVKKFPTNSSVMALKKNYDAQQANMEEAQKRQREYAEKEQLWVGKTAPELSLPDANGKNLPISSFRGKYLLVDFWASWCGPCRGENPNLVRVFNQYKNKNFTILGVSIDRGKDEWLQAVQDDQLSWNHVSDLRYWDSKAVETYKFDAIPYNVLIDPQGKVIAENLRGSRLDEKLQEVLK
ncbi:MAG TPA: TlpA disulfide reductase family protein [Chitinophagaceae bacterium]|nr:TlpA disulfide reductase family protein [Chitinophagaceae bacterium]